jgi:hypothetical protein
METNSTHRAMPFTATGQTKDQTNTETRQTQTTHSPYELEDDFFIAGITTPSPHTFYPSSAGAWQESSMREALTQSTAHLPAAIAVSTSQSLPTLPTHGPHYSQNDSHNNSHNASYNTPSTEKRSVRFGHIDVRLFDLEKAADGTTPPPGSPSPEAEPTTTPENRPETRGEETSLETDNDTHNNAKKDANLLSQVIPFALGVFRAVGDIIQVVRNVQPIDPNAPDYALGRVEGEAQSIGESTGKSPAETKPQEGLPTVYAPDTDSYHYEP